MPFKREDLRYRYSWVHTREDDPKLSGEPDGSLLNRGEGYEVLYLIRQLMAAWRLEGVAAGRKVERMIREHPVGLRSQLHVKAWIYSNWDHY